MNFIVYDLILLGVFVLFVFIFIARKRKNLKREGLLLLYPTKWGIKLINRIGKKYEKVLNVLSYVSITLGFILMGGVFYMLGRIVWIFSEFWSGPQLHSRSARAGATAAKKAIEKRASVFIWGSLWMSMFRPFFQLTESNQNRFN